MLGRRAVIAIIGIISSCGLFLLLIACCIVYYRRHLRQKAHTYVTAAQADDDRTNEQISMEQPRMDNQTTNYATSDAPPPYEEAVRLRIDQ